MDAAANLASTSDMRLSDYVLVCLCATSVLQLGCGPEPTVKQPDTSASVASTAGPGPSATASTASTSSSASLSPSATSSSTAPVASAASSASTAPTSDPTLEPGTTLVGTLSNAEIQKTVNDNIQAFDACYTLGADKQGKLEGTVTVRLTVGPLGTVKDSTLMKSTIKNSKVNTCVVDAFKKLKFPQPRGGAAIITYPMTFGGEVVLKK